MEGRLGKRSARLSVASEPETEASQRRKRVRWAGDVQPELGTPRGSVADHPTDAERAAAQSVIEAMRRAAVEPKILKNNAPADPVVVACALAIHFGQKFDSDSAAKEQFDIPRTTNVKVRWVDGKLAQLAAADPDALAAVATTFSPGPPSRPRPPGPPRMTPPTMPRSRPSRSRRPSRSSSRARNLTTTTSPGMSLTRASSKSTPASPSTRAGATSSSGRRRSSTNGMRCPTHTCRATATCGRSRAWRRSVATNLLRRCCPSPPATSSSPER